MASVNKKWWGFNLNLNHGEACAWTSAVGGGSSTKDIVQALGQMGLAAWFGPYAAVAAAIIMGCSSYIRSLNVQSGGKGVRLKFSWAGVYLGCSRRGKGSSPC